jgi:hypothetical protein
MLTLLFGFWLSGLGKPYHGLLFNIHKLVALGAVVFTVWQLAGLLKEMGVPALVIALLTVAGLCVIALFASGALLSLGKANYALLLTLHRLAPAALVLALGLAVYLLTTSAGSFLK